MSVKLCNVSKRVGAEMHIYETDLTLEAGAFNILLGTTLSGKTTLMRLMAGLEKPNSGEVWVNDENVTGVPVQKRNVAMVYQAFINYPSYTVYENIASPLKVAGLSKSEINDRVNKVATILKLTPMLDRLPGELSGGQQQRTALARALVKGSELVLLDEPLANLDYKLREELRDELPRIFEETGATVVYATSEPLEALMLGGNTATLHCGRIVQFGKTQDVYKNPVNIESAKIFSDPPINIAEINKQGDTIHLNDNISWTARGHISSLQDGTYMIGVRPHHLKPEKDAIEVTAEVLIAEISGSESIIHMTLEGNNWVSRHHGVKTYNVGEKSSFYFNTEHCLYFDQEGKFITT